jgi:hypothetical protein
MAKPIKKSTKLMSTKLEKKVQPLMVSLRRPVM